MGETMGMGCSSCSKPVTGFPIYIEDKCVYVGPYRYSADHEAFMGWHIVCEDCGPLTTTTILSSPEELALWVMSNGVMSNAR